MTVLPTLLLLLPTLFAAVFAAAASPSSALASTPIAPDMLPRCDAAVARCASLRLWLAVDEPRTAEAAAWDLTFLKTELEAAQREHAAADLSFEVVAIHVLDASHQRIVTRAERDALGHARWERGVIDVFVVAQLANVDEPGDIRGVHWRSRKDRTRRWVILSRISPPKVLAHELGHYFGLAHSDVPASLMNTGPKALPERTFQPDETARVRRRAKALFADGTVRDARPATPP